MLKENDEELQTLTDRKQDELNQNETEKNKSPRRKKKHKKKKKDYLIDNLKDDLEQEKKKMNHNSDQFIINGRFNLLKILGSGSFGEIHLSYDTQKRDLFAIKFELLSVKNPQLKHEFNILEHLNKRDNSVNLRKIHHKIST